MIFFGKTTLMNRSFPVNAKDNGNAADTESSFFSDELDNSFTILRLYGMVFQLFIMKTTMYI